MELLKLDSVTKSYKPELFGPTIPAVRAISFVINPGEIVGFVGPNGAGKTSTIKMIMGLLSPSSGSISLFDTSPGDPASRSRMGFVPEQPYFYDYLSVAESLWFYGEIKGCDRSSLAAQIPAILEQIGLTSSRNKKMKQLSKGMQQRLNLGQSLLGDPDFFIFDEPMSGLDPPGRTLFRSIFRKLHAEGKTIFFSTHILEDIESLCSRVVVLDAGVVSYDGSIDALLNRGFLGMELTVADLPIPMRKECEGRGIAVSAPYAGTTTLFVPAHQDALALQRQLSDQGIPCLQIVRKVESLETLLYQGSVPRVEKTTP